MKAKTSLLAVALIFGAISAQETAHAQDALTKKSVQSASVKLSVPTGGESATYVVNGKTFTVKPGQDIVIPVQATQLSLPKGAILTATASVGGAATEVVVSVKNSFSMSSMKAIAENVGSLKLISWRRELNGEKSEYDAVKDVLTITKSGVVTKVNPKAEQAQKQLKEVAEVIRLSAGNRNAGPSTDDN